MLWRWFLWTQWQWRFSQGTNRLICWFWRRSATIQNTQHRDMQKTGRQWKVNQWKVNQVRWCAVVASSFGYVRPSFLHPSAHPSIHQPNLSVPPPGDIGYHCLSTMDICIHHPLMDIWPPTTHPWIRPPFIPPYISPPTIHPLMNMSIYHPPTITSIHPWICASTHENLHPPMDVSIYHPSMNMSKHPRVCPPTMHVRPPAIHPWTCAPTIHILICSLHHYHIH